MHKPEQEGDYGIIELREGLKVRIEPCPDWTPYHAFFLAWSSSVLLDGKSVHISGLMPGVAMHISTRLPLHQGLREFIAAAWPHALQQIQAWQQLPGYKPRTKLIVPYSEAWIDEVDDTLPPASVHFQWLTLPKKLDRHGAAKS